MRLMIAVAAAAILAPAVPTAHPVGAPGANAQRLATDFSAAKKAKKPAKKKEEYLKAAPGGGKPTS